MFNLILLTVTFNFFYFKKKKKLVTIEAEVSKTVTFNYSKPLLSIYKMLRRISILFFNNKP